VQLFLGLGEEGISPRFGEWRELLKIYGVIYGTLLGVILDPISPILRVEDHLGSTAADSIRNQCAGWRPL
jgi:hypothetical protein